ncbi:ATP-binding protein [Coleofasciculus sp. G2-EDA-02]|uniref:ATP-binding protein n=1 Tax=Coleofasciculus sp. G2-EDA-02 TaxID=3069529 RepID=UPI0032F0B838
MSTPSLKECAAPVPICSQTTDLTALLEIFHASGSDSIVVVSEQQYPLGVVNLRKIIPHLLTGGRSAATLGERATEDFSQPLSELEPSVIEPLAILPASLTISQFWTILPDLDGGTPDTPLDTFNIPYPKGSRQWALVEPNGRFLGLLNSWQLLQFLAPKSQTEDVETRHGASLRQGGFCTNIIINSQKEVLKPAPTTHSLDSREGFPNPQSLLIQFLEQLPLPLSLQTATGQVLSENLAWRQQIGLWWDYPTGIESTSVESPSNVGVLSYNPHSESTRYCANWQTNPQVTEPLTVADPKPTPMELNNREKPVAWGVGYEPQPIFTSPRAIGCDYGGDRTRPMATHAQHPELESTATSPYPQDSQIDREMRETTTIQDRQFSLTKMPLSPSLFPELATENWKNLPRKDSPWHVSTQSDTANSPIAENTLSPPNSQLWLVMAQDTTDQQQVAQELTAKNADLVQLNRLKDEFLACISHELKTPLTAVLGLSTLLKDQSLGELNQRQARYARLIYQNGRQLMAVVNDILDLTRMETGQLELTLEPVQIQSLCDRAYKQALQVYSDKDQTQEGTTPDISFVLEIEPGIETIIADELRLRQMLTHLLSNALKFTDSQNTVGLKVNNQDGWIAFTIWDTGIGIPEDKQHLIFQKFQQLEEPLTRRFEGTGLGLVLTQRLARLHGGDISFISKSGNGSEFTLLLPPCPPSGRDLAETEDWGQANANFPFPNRNRLVLIVETVPRYLESVTVQLKQLGYWVVNARSGPEALSKARSLQPSIILLNPLLPQVSGWDVLTLLKSDPQTCHIPILVTATQAEKEQAYKNKADGFLSLPVQGEALAKSLTRLGKHQRSPNQVLTLLYLSAGLVEVPPESSKLISQLTDALSCQHSDLKYRILEADDLEQAELLARVWHPDIVLLDGAGINDPPGYFKTYSLYPTLADLPLITLDHQTTEAANQAMGLSVYPCLAPDNPQKITTLLQVIQIAAGVSRKSSILIFDLGDTQGVSPKYHAFNTNPVTPYTPWLRALIQYLQAAGFRSLFSHCWSDVWHQLQQQMVDVLLIRIKDIENDSGVVQGLRDLSQLPNRPPILLLDHRLPDSSLHVGVSESDQITTELESQLQSVATKILPGRSHSMSQLLEQIYQVLG